MRYLWIAAGLLPLLVGCATTTPGLELEETASQGPQPAPPLNHALFDAPGETVFQAELFGLKKHQEREFLAFYNDRDNQDLRPHQRLARYLEQRASRFTYLDSTLEPSVALERNAGNCMSLAALTLSLADLVGLDIDFQLMNTPPIFDRDSRTLLSSGHVRTRVYDPPRPDDMGPTVLVRAHSIIDYFPGRDRSAGEKIPLPEFFAMFYRNMATEHMLEGDLDLAYALALKALEHSPEHVDPWNLLAILHKRRGDLETAESIYQYVLQLHPNQLAPLSNYINLLESQGRTGEAALLSKQMQELDDPNPFPWIELAEQAMEQGRYHRALRRIERALKMAPYLHEAYWKKAVIYTEMGSEVEAKDAMAQAISLAPPNQTRSSYKAKLHSLQ